MHAAVLRAGSTAIALLLILAIALCGCVTSDEDDEDESENGNSTVIESLGEGIRSMPASMSGVVLVDGRPLAYGTIMMYDADENLVGQERPDENGRYRIRDLHAGIHKVYYLNAMGAPIGEPVIVDIRPGRFEQVDLEYFSQN